MSLHSNQLRAAVETPGRIAPVKPTESPRSDVASVVVSARPSAAVTRTEETAERPKPARSSARSHPKARAQSAWTAWVTGGLEASEAEFFLSVSSWTEGTAAQLLRQPWPALSKRPTSADVEERLRHHLRVAAGGEQTTYIEGLNSARGGVIEELRRARQAAGTSSARHA